MTDVFTPKPKTDGEGGGATNTDGNQTSHLDLVVQQKGENWRDIEVLAKGKLDSDSHIAMLEQELEQLRSKNTESDEVQKLLDALKGKATEAGNENPSANGNAGGTQNEDTPPVVTEETLERLVVDTITKREASATKEANVKTVNEKMLAAYGDAASTELQKKADQLSLSVERLRELAGESPNAFMSLMGVESKTETSNTFGSGGTSTRTNPTNIDSNERDWNYYKKMRKENRASYYSPATQRQLLADRVRLGDRFGV